MGASAVGRHAQLPCADAPAARALHAHKPGVKRGHQYCTRLVPQLQQRGPQRRLVTRETKISHQIKPPQQVLRVRADGGGALVLLGTAICQQPESVVGFVYHESRRRLGLATALCCPRRVSSRLFMFVRYFICGWVSALPVVTVCGKCISPAEQGLAGMVVCSCHAVG
jgi:hypothetical protein